MFIFPQNSQIISINPITPHFVKGLGGTSVVAKGVSTIKLHVRKDLYIILRGVLHIPNATITLISIWCLACNPNTVTHFDQDCCWLTNKNEDSIIACHILLPHTNLYAHSLYHSATNNAYTIHSIPTLKTSHHCLGHANYNSIGDMARHGLLKGVPLHITHIPSKCKFCVLGKQTQTAVPKH